MKHLKKTLLTLTALFALSTGAGATELTVSDGTSQHYFPFNNSYIYCFQKNEMLFPAEELTAMTGQNITSMQFYGTQESLTFGDARFKVFLKEVSTYGFNNSTETQSSFYGTNGATTVYEGELSVADSKLTVTFTTPYAYNGGNLLVGFYIPTPDAPPTGPSTSLSFYGISTASVSSLTQEASDAGGFDGITTGKNYSFSPKTTFTYSNVEMNDDMTEATFTMPASDATVGYELVRDMEYQVAFSGLAERIIVKQGGDNKYQPLTPLTIQLIDQLAATDAQDIIAAEGIKVNVLKGTENNGTITYDESSAIAYDVFLADMQPGLYKIVAEPTDATTSPYTGTASLAFEALAGYPVDVAANEYVTYYSATDNLTVDDEDAQLYTITAVSGSEATAEEISGANKEMPFLVYNNSDKDKTIILIPTDVVIAGQAHASEFVGTAEATTIAASTDALNNYAFNGKKFVWVMEDLPVAANKAWLAIPATPSSARTINLVFGDATAIGAVSGSPADNGDIYDLNGRKLDKKPTRKGVYIQNGRKVVIK